MNPLPLSQGLAGLKAQGACVEVFNFELDENGRPVDPNHVVWRSLLQHRQRFILSMVTRTGCGLIIVNIDILYRCANKVSCKIRIELLLPIYMTNS